MDTLRVVYRGIHSKTSGDFLSTDYVNWTVLRITWPPIHSNSIVLISASECRTDDVQRFTPFFERYVGDAAITVRNISPQDGFVDFWIYVDWEHPLNVAVDLVVLDPPILWSSWTMTFKTRKSFRWTSARSTNGRRLRSSPRGNASVDNIGRSCAPAIRSPVGGRSASERSAATPCAYPDA
jgi:hypothetical protein